MSNSPILSERIIPSRGAALRATASFAGQLLSSPGRSDDEPPPDGFGEPAGRKSGVKYRYSGKGKFLASPLKLSVSPEQPMKKRKSIAKPFAALSRVKTEVKNPKKRKASVAISEKDTASSLTTLSPSPLSTAPPSPFVQSKELPPSSTSTNTSHEQTSLAPPGSQKAKPSKMKTSGLNKSVNDISPKPLFATTPRKSNGEEAWSLKNIGDFVWVLLDESGVVAKDNTLEKDDDMDLEEKMWWPARITQKTKSTPVHISLFGQLPSGVKGSLTIKSPSSQNLLSLHTKKGMKRFTLSTFRSSSFPMSPSAKKKHKSDIAHSWEAAVEDMAMAAEDEDDGLPDLLSTYTGSFYEPPPQAASDSDSPARSRAKKGKGKMRDDDASMSPDRSWTPPAPDITLQIPGESVFAMAPRSTKFWPARLLEYIPPTKPKQKQKYRAIFLDDEEYLLPREKFYVFGQPEFATCEVGKFESAVRDDEDIDTEEDPELPIRGPSPVPVLPLSRPFVDLTIHEQFGYVKPVLLAVLNGTYAPARSRHDRFIKGGAARTSLQQDAAVRGDLSPAEIKKIQTHLCEWTLRQDRFAKRMDVDTPQIDPPLPSLQQEEEAGPSHATDMDVVPQSKAEGDDPEQTSDPSVPQESSGLLPEDGSCIAIESSLPKEGEETTMAEVFVDNHESADLDRPDPPLIPESSGPPRQVGCPEYEALSGVEKLDYCLSVLLPESVQQILLWRSEDRASMELLSAEEEQALYDLGSQKRNETDWVFDLMRLREAQQRILLTKQSKNMSSAVKAPAAPNTPTTGGTRSRPRRSTVSGR
ncbi:hypothetical protein BJ138DRAFT_1144736 [Hygrophoropsis aurantiaca]|uniref:Uncharacterized protein n=1 Tax=Hygrophoropsis aurantiaca TaxID=72124 RepID=A0ACB8AL95_9AGAM|nr:hypothetical protein BJ138DRAFT_1144736 [Hygrophoropsis aurantiaca]